MKKWGMALAALAGIAVACEVVDGSFVTVTVEVSSLATLSERLEEIGDALEDTYGDLLTDQRRLVRVPTKVCVLLWCGMSLETNIEKMCGESMKQAAYRYAAEAAREASSGGGGEGAGEGSWADIGGSDDPAKDCMVEMKHVCVTVGEEGDSATNCSTYSELNCPVG